ncbi:mast cell protease 1A-like [Pteropus medius]|uniref:mast cell protease 1A-like n=1 Tax=Pteropus vampyrus TaxID=132908 RepID=UPI00196B7DDC|nr:mast cell protease 1A-like [Pteropus giganteus]
MQPLLLLLAFLLSPKAEAGKIIGGHEAKPHSLPYMAFLRIKSPKHNVCGGFLVSEDFVLTAAHCWGSSISVTLGAHNILEQEKTQQVILVTRAIPHPDYNPDTKANDIMLLQLKKKANLTAAVRILSLPRRIAQVKPGMGCSVAGWGRQGVTTNLSVRLREVELEIQSDKQCNSHYKDLYDSTTQICVGNPTKIQNSFKGDSGGPLVCNNMAQGIVSYGKKDARPPSVYTRISSFLKWIARTMRYLKLQRPN